MNGTELKEVCNNMIEYTIRQIPIMDGCHALIQILIMIQILIQGWGGEPPSYDKLVGGGCK